jgi:hypothetical protein
VKKLEHFAGGGHHGPDEALQPEKPQVLQWHHIKNSNL